MEGKGRSQSPVHGLSRIEGGGGVMSAGTESVVMSSLARSLTRLSLSHTHSSFNFCFDRHKDRRVHSSGAVCPHCSPMSISQISLALSLSGVLQQSAKQATVNWKDLGVKG